MLYNRVAKNVEPPKFVEVADTVLITRDNFDMILRENPGIVLAILREMATRLKTTSAALSAARGA